MPRVGEYFWLLREVMRSRVGAAVAVALRSRVGAAVAVATRPRLRLALAAAIVLALAAPAVALAEYGAIAVNRHTGQDGIAVAPRLHTAVRVAKHACAGDCVVLAWTQSRCAAVVHVRRGKRHYWAGFGSTRLSAEASARGAAGNPHARVTGWVCAAPGNAPLTWGAIALRRRTGTAAIGGGPTKRAAKRVAKEGCNQSCRIVLTVHDECGVLLFFRGHYWTGIGFTATAAEDDARLKADPRAHLLTGVCAGAS